MSALAEPLQSTSSIPELGQLVEVRRRHWAVSKVQPSTIGDRAQHLVSLTSLDDDASGEEVFYHLGNGTGRNNPRICGFT